LKLERRVLDGATMRAAVTAQDAILRLDPVQWPILSGTFKSCKMPETVLVDVEGHRV